MPRPRDVDLQALPELRVGLIVCLLESAVLTYTTTRGLRVLRLPIDDRRAPADAHMPLIAQLCAVMHAFRLRPGPRNGVAVHCLGGQGRTGLVLASYSSYLAAVAPGDRDAREPPAAINAIRQHLARTYGVAQLGPNPQQCHWIARFFTYVRIHPHEEWAARAVAEVSWRPVGASLAACENGPVWQCPECGALAAGSLSQSSTPIWCPSCWLPTGNEESAEGDW